MTFRNNLHFYGEVLASQTRGPPIVGCPLLIPSQFKALYDFSKQASFYSEVLASQTRGPPLVGCPLLIPSQFKALYDVSKQASFYSEVLASQTRGPALFGCPLLLPTIPGDRLHHRRLSLGATNRGKERNTVRANRQK
jgi:hypothetical protein